MKRIDGAELLDRLGIGIIIVLAVLALALLLLPAVIVVMMSFDTRGYISFPPAGFTLDWYVKVFNQPALVNADVDQHQGLALCDRAVHRARCPDRPGLRARRFPGRHRAVGLRAGAAMVPGIVLGVAVLFSGALLGIGPSIWLQSVSLSVYVMAVMVRTVMARLQRLDPAAGSRPLPSRREPLADLPHHHPATAAARDLGRSRLHLYRGRRQSLGDDLHPWLSRPATADRTAGHRPEQQFAVVAAVSSVQILLAMLPFWRSR